MNDLATFGFLDDARPPRDQSVVSRRHLTHLFQDALEESAEFGIRRGLRACDRRFGPAEEDAVII